jgi:hypothetical protein
MAERVLELNLDTAKAFHSAESGTLFRYSICAIHTVLAQA